MTASNSNSVVALQNVLDGVLDGINQLFFHSRALRAWGISEIGRAEHLEWVAKMQRAELLVSRLTASGGLPRSRKACDLTLAGDIEGVLRSNLALTERLIDTLDGAIASSGGDDMTTGLLNDCLQSEQAYAKTLRDVLASDTLQATSRHAKYLLPKDKGEAAIEAINRAMPVLTDAVSQCFYHSLMFDSWGQQDLGERELNAALDKMYRSEALLERLLDLGGAPDGRGFGAVQLGTNEAEIDSLSLEAQRSIPALIMASRDLVDPGLDPTTYVLIDGILRGEQADMATRQSRVA